MKTIDISYGLSSNTPVYPGDVQMELYQNKTLENDYYNAFLLHGNLHTGTHVDVPMHLLPDDRTIDCFPIEHFFGRGVLLDVRGENPIEMKEAYEKIITKGDIVLLYTGFDEWNQDENIYFHQHPVVAENLGLFLKSRQIKMLGMDMPSPDFPPFHIHKMLLNEDIFILENITNLKALLQVESFEVFAVPLKIAAEASFVRAFARIHG